MTGVRREEGRERRCERRESQGGSRMRGRRGVRRREKRSEIGRAHV